MAFFLPHPFWLWLAHAILFFLFRFDFLFSFFLAMPYWTFKTKKLMQDVSRKKLFSQNTLLCISIQLIPFLCPWFCISAKKCCSTSHLWDVTVKGNCAIVLSGIQYSIFQSIWSILFTIFDGPAALCSDNMVSWAIVLYSESITLQYWIPSHIRLSSCGKVD